MKIIAGSLKGKTIDLPKKHNLFHHGDHRVRPTKSLVREAIFNILKNNDFLPKEFENCHFLDLCCGTGTVGFEALSRGIHQVTFADNNPLVLQIIRYNCEKLELLDRTRTRKVDLRHITKSVQPYDIVFMDPPYTVFEPDEVLTRLKENEWLSDGCICIFENKRQASKVHSDYICPSDFTVIKKKTYGHTELVVYQYNSTSFE